MGLNSRTGLRSKPLSTVDRIRLRLLAERLHDLGAPALFHFLDEVERGADLWPLLDERYATLPADFIKAYASTR